MFLIVNFEQSAEKPGRTFELSENQAGAASEEVFDYDVQPTSRPCVGRRWAGFMKRRFVHL